MQYFPIFVGLKGKSCLVAGGGQVAARKVRLLKRAGADVLVVAPLLDAELRALHDAREIRYQASGFSRQHLQGQWLVIAATDDPATNQEIFRQAEEQGVLANCVDDPAHCRFITPAIVDRSPVIVAISTGGAAPVLARRLREQLEQLLPQRLGGLARMARRWRSRVKATIDSISARRLFWETFFGGKVADYALAGRVDQAETTAATLLAQQSGQATTGHVGLVGAGPGDAGLLTLRALQLMQLADVVLYDRLVSSEVLDLVRRDAELISVGKAAAAHTLDQQQINGLLLKHANQGRRVVRLKGGDPFVFGRGGEELEQLRAAGIQFEVVPGITAALGCSSYAGIPLTHRDYSHSVQIVTAHCQKLLECVDWPSLTGKAQTLVFYMTVKNLPQIQLELIKHGLQPDLPIALVENGTRPEQRVVTGPLCDLASIARRHNIKAPAVLIVGQVVRLRDQCDWFSQPALPLSA